MGSLSRIILKDSTGVFFSYIKFCVKKQKNYSHFVDVGKNHPKKMKEGENDNLRMLPPYRFFGRILYIILFLQNLFIKFNFYHHGRAPLTDWVKDAFEAM